MDVGCWTLWLSLVLGAATLLVLWWRRYVGIFADRGVPYVTPLPLVGNMVDVVLNKKSMPDILVDLYRKMDPHPYAGAFLFMSPFLFLRDLDLIRAITVKDFDHFPDHMDFFNEDRSNPLSKRMLFSLKGSEWHEMRAKLSPAFTAMKMKNTFTLIREIGQQVVAYLDKQTADLKGLTNDDMASQAIMFFFGGFDTESAMMTFCSYLLATNEDVQMRLQQEVDDVMKKSGGQPDYEQVMGCQYLDMVLCESLRMYTSGTALVRLCVRPYQLPDTQTCQGVKLRPGDIVWVPVHAIHRDPKYFPDPDRFDPERFSPENKQNIKPFTYFPFGSGPRACIAKRFALIELKVVLLYLMSKFSFQVVPKTPVPLQIQPNKMTLRVKGGAWIGIRRRS